jgi:hypothetical protein
MIVVHFNDLRTRVTVMAMRGTMCCASGVKSLADITVDECAVVRLGFKSAVKRAASEAIYTLSVPQHAARADVLS